MERPESVSLVRAMLALGRSGSTGVLTITAGGRRCRIEVRAGMACSATGSFGTLLIGDVLQQRGEFDAAAHRAALDRAAPPGPVGAWLVAQGVTTPRALERALREQLRERVLSALAWRELSYTFTPIERRKFDRRAAEAEAEGSGDAERRKFDRRAAAAEAERSGDAERRRLDRGGAEAGAERSGDGARRKFDRRAAAAEPEQSGDTERRRLDRGGAEAGPRVVQSADREQRAQSRPEADASWNANSEQVTSTSHEWAARGGADERDAARAREDPAAGRPRSADSLALRALALDAARRSREPEEITAWLAADARRIYACNGYGRRLLREPALFDQPQLPELLAIGATLEQLRAAAGASLRDLQLLAGLRWLGAFAPAADSGSSYALLLRKQRELRRRVGPAELLDLGAGETSAAARRALRRLARHVHPDALGPSVDPALRRLSTELMAALIDAERQLRR